jgi:nitroreductase
MCRAFSPEPLAVGVVDRLLRMATQAPSAGFTQGVDWLVLESPGDRSKFFKTTSQDEWLADAGPMAGLLDAPLIVVPVASPDAYVQRYSEKDKAGSGLARLAAAEWPVAYWTVDASMGVMLLLLAAEDAGLGALFFRLHRPARTLLDAFAIPPGSHLIGAVAIGWPAPASSRSGSPTRRSRRPFGELIHKGAW